MKKLAITVFFVGLLSGQSNVNWKTQVKNKDFISAVGSVATGGCGLKMDGTTNDTTALATCITNLVPTNGGTIVFPAGTAIIGGLNITKHNVKFLGQGRGSFGSGSSDTSATVLKYPASGTHPASGYTYVLKFGTSTQTSGGSLEDIAIFGVNGGNTAQIGVWYQDHNAAKNSSWLVKGPSFAGVYIAGYIPCGSGGAMWSDSWIYGYNGIIISDGINEGGCSNKFGDVQILHDGRPMNHGVWYKGPSATSSSNNSIGVGSKTFTVASGLPFVVGARVKAVSTTTPTAGMTGTITSYSGTSLVATFDTTFNSGTYSSWRVGTFLGGDSNTFDSLNIGQYNDLSLTGISCTSGICTATTSAAHGIVDFDGVFVYGASDNRANGSYLAKYVSSTSFSYDTNNSHIGPAPNGSYGTATDYVNGVGFWLESAYGNDVKHLVVSRGMLFSDVDTEHRYYGNSITMASIAEQGGLNGPDVVRADPGLFVLGSAGDAYNLKMRNQIHTVATISGLTVNDDEWTIVPFDVNIRNIGNAHSTTVENHKFMPPANAHGPYLITCTVTWADNTRDGYRYLRISDNTGIVRYTSQLGLQSNNTSQEITVVKYLVNTTHFLALEVYQNNTANVAIGLVTGEVGTSCSFIRMN